MDHRPALVPLPVAHDPTIQSMLVMIDAIHERLSRDDHDFDGALGAAVVARRGRDPLPVPADRRHGVRRRPLHQDELAREAAHRVRDLQGAVREGPGSHREGRPSSVRSSTGVVGPPLALPGRRQPRRRRVHELPRLHRRRVRVALRGDPGSRLPPRSRPAGLRGARGRRQPPRVPVLRVRHLGGRDGFGRRACRGLLEALLRRRRPESGLLLFESQNPNLFAACLETTGPSSSP